MAGLPEISPELTRRGWVTTRLDANDNVSLGTCRPEGTFLNNHLWINVRKRRLGDSANKPVAKGFSRPNMHTRREPTEPGEKKLGS